MIYPSRLANRVQVTTDGHRAYLEAIDTGFGVDVDYAQLIKLYGEVPHPAGRYSPAQIQGTKTFCCPGKPDPAHIIDQLRRAPESHHAHVDEAVYAIEQRLLEKGREPCLFGRDPLHALQLRAHSSKPADHPGDGGWRIEDALVSCRYGAGDRGLGSGAGRSSWAIGWSDDCYNSKRPTTQRTRDNRRTTRDSRLGSGSARVAAVGPTGRSGAGPQNSRSAPCRETSPSGSA